MTQRMHIDQATGQQIVFPVTGWVVKQAPGSKSIFIINPTGDTLRVPDEIAEHLAQALLTIHHHTQAA